MGAPQIVLKKAISLWEDPGTKNRGLETKKEVFKVLSKVIDESQCFLWLDVVLHTAGQGSIGPFVNNVYVFGKREIILFNLRKIVERIAAGKQWEKEGVWIGFDLVKKPKIENVV